MRSIAPMQTAKIGYIIMSALLCLFGIVLITSPGFSIVMIERLCSVILIVFGGIKIIGYFSRDLYRLAFQFDLAFGILIILIGLVMLISPESAMNFICAALGLIILADGLFKIQISIDSKKFGLKDWWMILVIAIVTGGFGLALIFKWSESAVFLTMILGIALLFEGILNMFTVITAVKIIKHQQPDIIDI